MMLGGHSSARTPAHLPASPPTCLCRAAGTCCAGHFHAYQDAQKNESSCAGGGLVAAPQGDGRSTRVDRHDVDGWRGTQLSGCAAQTHWLPTGNLLTPR